MGNTEFYLWLALGGVALLLLANMSKSARGWLKVQRALSTWVAVPATIERSTALHGRSSKGPTSQVAIEYRFSVDGHDYTGSTYEYGVDRRYFVPQADRIVSEFPAGAKTTAYYDPANPASNALILAIGQARYQTIGVAVVLIILALIWALVIIPGVREQEKEQQALLAFDAGASK